MFINIGGLLCDSDAGSARQRQAIDPTAFAMAWAIFPGSGMFACVAWRVLLTANPTLPIRRSSGLGFTPVCPDIIAVVVKNRALIVLFL